MANNASNDQANAGPSSAAAPAAPGVSVLEGLRVWDDEKKTYHEVTVGEAADEAYDYPRAFFEKNPGKKPALLVGEGGAIADGTIWHMVKGISDKMDEEVVNTVVRYMYHVALKIKTIMEDDWVSFGTTIAKKGNECNSLSMYDVQVLPALSGKAGTDGANDKISQTGLMTFLCGLYRIHNASNNEYRQSLANRFKEQCANQGLSVGTMGLAGGFAALAGAPAYTRIVAGIDMYLHKHRDPLWTPLRVGSISTRMSQMVMVPVFNKIFSTMESCRVFLSWCKHEKLEKEMLRYIKNQKQEFGLPDSYVHYSHEMGLIKHSPFTASANPSLVVFYHGSAALNGVVRSQNAKVPNSVDPEYSLMRLIMCYAFASSRETTNRVGLYLDQADSDRAKAQRAAIQNRMAAESASGDQLDPENLAQGLDQGNLPTAESNATPRQEDYIGWQAICMDNDHDAWVEITQFVRSALRHLAVTKRAGSIAELMVNRLGPLVGLEEATPAVVARSGAAVTIQPRPYQ